MRSIMASARVLSPLQICWYHSLSRNCEQKIVEDFYVFCVSVQNMIDIFFIITYTKRNKSIVLFSNVSFQILHFKLRNTHNEKKASLGSASHIYIRSKENAVASTLLCVDAAGIKGVQVNIGVFDGVRIEHETAID